MTTTSYHTHSSYCDGSGGPEEYIQTALERGFAALGFSSHAPLPFPNDWTMKKGDTDTYLAEIRRLKDKYSGKIEIYTALEIDYISGLMAPSDPEYRRLGLDYIIGSVHVLKDVKTGDYPGIDYTDEDMDQLLNNTFHNDIRLLVENYYTTVKEMIISGGFTILGHLDVVKKTNVKEKYFTETAEWYRKIIADTLNVVQKSGLIMEVNTGNSRWIDEASIFPSPWILSTACRLGIPVMLNSDAHRPDRIDSHFPEALRILKDSGYREITILRENSFISLKID